MFGRSEELLMEPTTVSRKWTAIAPIHNLALDTPEYFEFSRGVRLGPKATWVSKDPILKSFGVSDFQGVEDSKYEFMTEYYAEAWGSPDPNWKGSGPRSIQDSQYESVALANLALWLSQPSPACFTLMIHAPHFDGKPTIVEIQRYSPILCHPRDLHNRVSVSSIKRAQRLNAMLADVRFNTSMWTALRAVYSGLQMNTVEIRYSLFWIAIEALFGPDDGREITFRLAQRIALFLASKRSAAKDTATLVKKAYALRSKLVHGNWTPNPTVEALMADTENIARSCLCHILEETTRMEVFMSKSSIRESYLDDLPFKD
jgi:hypothetical protein